MYRDLKLSDRAKIIGLAVKSGITDLRTIENVYNTFAQGGRLFEDGGDEEKTTPPTDNTGKSWYENTLNYLFGGTRGLIESEYKPTRGDKGEKYYTRKGLKNDVVLNLLGGIDAGALNKDGTPKYYASLNDAYEHLSKLNDRGLSAPRTAGNATLGEYGVSAGSDNHGRYISFSDKFDYRVLPMIFGDSLHPYQLYDRIYEDEWDSLSKLQANGDPNSGNIFLRPGGGGAGGSIYADGGHMIHIKKKNRGKFTALKKRTGHSASWFKAHGTPAQKKMAVFALNARKWKHGKGGYLMTKL